MAFLNTQMKKKKSEWVVEKMQRNLHQQEEGVMVCLISDTFQFSRAGKWKITKKDTFNYSNCSEMPQLIES
jgi:hypothetical protein